jgi:mono/diheme cytochrome c family protein
VPPAPAFRSIAKSRQFLAKGAKFLWEKHGTMPNFALTGEEADDVAAYIRTLGK